MLYIKVKDLEERTSLLKYLKDNEVLAVFHYVPLHSSHAGIKYGRFIGEDRYTTIESDRLIRLPMYYELEAKTIELIINLIIDFYR